MNKFFVISFGLMFCVLHTYGQKLNSMPDSIIVNLEKQKLKNYAFCACLHRFNSKYDEYLNDGSAAGYFETSNYSITAFEKLDSFVLNFNFRKYESKYEESLIIMKCLDFYNSEQLENGIKKITKEFIINEK
jgi:hypothetical protein